MRRIPGYKIAIIILSLLVIIEGIWLIILWTSRPPPKKIPQIALPVIGRIAIVVDDWGYNLNNLHILEQIKYPITISILPNLSYSKAVSGQLHKRGFEIMLHLPMEPREKYRLEQDTILISMDEATIKNIIGKDLTSVRDASGVSNHMGSRATEDSRTMGIIFGELKKRHLYFLDSLVSSSSICTDLANKTQIAFTKRDVFLDNKEEPEYIRGQIHKLKSIAKLYGRAIGVAHDRKVALEVLKEAMPELEKEGYKFVFVSELLR